jgi:hypothetical protein
MLSLTPLTVSSSTMSFASREGTGQSVEFGDDERVAVAARGECFAQSGACAVGAGESVVGVDQVRSNAEGFQGVALGSEILLVRGHACVSD